MTFKTHYEPVPVSVDPAEEGLYLVFNGTGWFEAFWNKQYGFHQEFCDCSGIESWLRPRPDTVLLTREEVEEIKKAEYQKGLNDSSPRFLR